MIGMENMPSLGKAVLSLEKMCAWKISDLENIQA
jgi:hypothetical protein